MSSNEYPEHLNPFTDEAKPKSKLTIRNSFKRLTRPLRQSFRKIIIRNDHRSDDEVEIRKSRPFPRFETTSLQQISRHSEAQEALPRSRFHERLTLSRNTVNDDGSSHNPFELNEDDGGSSQQNTLRRKKKRAPLPPKYFSNENVNDMNMPRASNWSLTSVETEYSDEHEPTNNGDIRDGLVMEQVIGFTKEMEKLIDNPQINSKQCDAVPDIVVSCASSENKANNNKDAPEISLNKETNILHEKNNNQTGEFGYESHMAYKVVGEAMDEKLIEESSQERPTVADEDVKDQQNSDELIVTEITHNLLKDTTEKRSIEVNVSENNKAANSSKDFNETETEELNYNARKSIYITGSKDELNNDKDYCDRVSIYIDDNEGEKIFNIENNNNNDKLENNCQQNEKSTKEDGAEVSTTVPIPKLRKRKLSKNELLSLK